MSTALFRALAAAPARQSLLRTALPAPIRFRNYSTEPTSTTTTTIPPSEATSATTDETAPAPTPTPNSPGPTGPTKNYPFRVTRTNSQALAVYQRAQAGGNKKLTLIKKIEGDRRALVAALAEGLGVDPGDFIMNNVTGHVVLKGHRREDVIAWLTKEGF
ncbi:mitochondrial large subunit ribosomal protein-domain-containing protein [Dichotomopilus funicola]|uniref:Large ribosomal subunit protein mL49 n=1 Tax=Dichotomopilus funicola TaxID=1934379 RepID=A0AAN6ZJS0_9PEZI|nr:mitochondrial large subunit ribosomal protein-domain-containing protein [Dichotomopilus funicola]